MALKNKGQIIRFIIVGTLNALIMCFVVWLMMEVLHFNYRKANVIAYVVAQVNNFLWSKYWVFSSKEKKFFKEGILFLLAFGCAYVSQFSVLLCMVELGGLNEYLAQFIGLFVYGAVNFLMNKKFTFIA